jgi:hypothetical protein
MRTEDKFASMLKKENVCGRARKGDSSVPCGKVPAQKRGESLGATSNQLQLCDGQSKKYGNGKVSKTAVRTICFDRAPSMARNTTRIRVP